MDDNSTAVKIKKAREAAGLTQAQLAERIGTTPQNISQYERGIRNPKYITVRKIADVVGCSPFDLVSDDEWTTVPQQISLAWGMTVDEIVNAKELFLKGFKDGQQEKYLLEAFELLNAKGKKVALERVDELLHIPNYCYYAGEIQKAEEKKDVQTAPTVPDDKDPAKK